MRTKDFKGDKEKIQVKSELRDNVLKAVVEGTEFEGELLRYSDADAVWKLGDRSVRIATAQENGKIWVAVDGRTAVFELAGEDDEFGGGRSG